MKLARVPRTKKQYADYLRKRLAAVRPRISPFNFSLLLFVLFLIGFALWIGKDL